MRFRWFAFGLTALLVGCQDPPAGPDAAAFEAERNAVAAATKTKKGRQVAKKGAAKAADPANRGGFGSFDSDFSYDGRRDPFRSFAWERPDIDPDAELRGPLEQFDVSQLSLLAIVWNVGSARALVQDPSGVSHIVSKGTAIGKNEGRVIEISDNLLVVKETYVDFLGEKTTKDIEMRIRRSQGG